MAGDTARLRSMIDSAVNALQTLNTAFTEEYPVAAQVIRVKVGEDVTAAITQARRDGTLVLLEPGEHFCNIVISDDPTAKTVIVTSDTAELPAPGERITRDYAPGLAVLRSLDRIAPALQYAVGSTGVNMVGVGFGPQAYDTTQVAFGTDAMTAISEQPHDVLFDRVLLFGDPVRGQHRGIQAHVNRFALMNSAFVDFHEQGRDAQCLAAWNGGQHLAITNCLFEGSGENVLFGGSKARTQEMAPSFISISGSHFTKNPKWLSGMQYQPVIKCLLEIKHARHVVIAGNMFENNWMQAWDNGVAIVFKCCDQYGDEPWTISEDITLEHNVCRRVGSFVALVAKDDGRKVTQLMKDVCIRHNLVYDLNVGPWVGTGRAFTSANMPESLNISHNTIIGNRNGLFYFWYDQAVKGKKFEYLNNIVSQGTYGLNGPAGMMPANWATDMGFAPTVAGNAMMKSPVRSLPFPGNTIIDEAAFKASLTSTLEVLPGSAIAGVVTTDGQMVGADLSKLSRVDLAG